MEMEDQYGMADLRQLMNGTRSHFPAIPQPTELFPGHHRPGMSPSVQPFEMMMMGGHPVVGPAAADILPPATSGGASITTITATSAPSLSGGGGGGGLELGESGGCLGMMDGGTGRWPRQETLTLLEIRSRLDSKFKEANQKGPLWDEVSSLSLSNSSEFDSSSSEDDFSNEKRKRSGSGGSSRWKVKIKEFIDSQMRKLMEKQETWLEKLMRTLEQKEKERSLREEEWRKQESARINKEHKFWAKERAWIEARDAALMDALHKLTGKEVHYNLSSSSPDQEEEEGLMLAATAVTATAADREEDERVTPNRDESTWPESEVSRLIQFRTSMDSRFEQGGFPEEVLWEDIAAKLACLGYERSGLMCKDKWESINHYVKNGSHTFTSLAAVTCSSICLFESARGLGFKSILDWNLATMFKYVCAIAKKKNNLWMNWVHNVYIKEENWWSYKTTPTASWYWRKMVAIKDKATGIFDVSQVLNDKYKVADGFQAIRPFSCKVEWNLIAWSRLNIPKHSFIFWLSMINRIKTKDRLQQYREVENSKCFLCNIEEEVEPHLFFDCPFSLDCLKKIKSWLNWRMYSCHFSQQNCKVDKEGENKQA
uniref:Myb-like domain-containing protein n=1 Tax=Cannabis sativa TaxID=3483 RepID=A0A803P5F4_CANSA